MKTGWLFTIKSLDVFRGILEVKNIKTKAINVDRVHWEVSGNYWLSINWQESLTESTAQAAKPCQTFQEWPPGQHPPGPSPTQQATHVPLSIEGLNIASFKAAYIACCWSVPHCSNGIWVPLGFCLLLPPSTMHNCMRLTPATHRYGVPLLAQVVLLGFVSHQWSDILLEPMTLSNELLQKWFCLRTSRQGYLSLQISQQP